MTDHRLGLSLMNLNTIMEGEGLEEFLIELERKHREDLLEEAAQS